MTPLNPGKFLIMLFYDFKYFEFDLMRTYDSFAVQQFRSTKCFLSPTESEGLLLLSSGEASLESMSLMLVRPCSYRTL